MHYHFLDKPTFREWIEKGEFLEHAEFVENYYGTPKRFVDEAMERGDDVILDIELQGVLQVHEKRPETVRIFLAPPSWEELERRLRNRGTEDDGIIQQRLFKAGEELGFKSSYDYIVENNFVEQCAESIINIYESEK